MNEQNIVPDDGVTTQPAQVNLGGFLPTSRVEEALQKQAEEARIKAKEMSFKEKLSLGVEAEWSPNIVANKFLANTGFEPDDNFKASNELFKEHADDIDPKYKVEIFKKAVSMPHFLTLVDYYRDAQKRDQELSALGWEGIAYRMGGAITDPAEFAATLATEGLFAPAAVMSKLTRVGKMVRMGLVHGGTQASFEIVRQADPTRSMLDVGIASAAGFLTGGLSGRFWKPSKADIDSMNKIIKQFAGTIDKPHLMDVKPLPEQVFKASDPEDLFYRMTKTWDDSARKSAEVFENSPLTPKGQEIETLLKKRESTTEIFEWWLKHSEYNPEAPPPGGWTKELIEWKKTYDEYNPKPPASSRTDWPRPKPKEKLRIDTPRGRTKPVHTEGLTWDVFKANLKKSFNKLTDNQRDTFLNLIEARARALNMTTESYIQRRFRDGAFYKGTARVEAKYARKGSTLKGMATHYWGIHEGKAIIEAFKAHDFATLVHEMGHLFRREIGGEDLQILEKAFGVKNGNWSPGKHVPYLKQPEELFARAFEKYVRDGVAPTPELKNVFERFKNWMQEIYSTITGSNLVEFSPDVKGVFDRLFMENASTDFMAAVRASQEVPTEKLTQQLAIDEVSKILSNTAEGKSFAANVRWGVHSLLQKSKSPTLQKWADQLVLDSAGKTKGAINQEGGPASVHARMEFQAASGKFYAKYKTAYSKYKDSLNLPWNQRAWDYEIKQQFNEEIGKALRSTNVHPDKNIREAVEAARQNFEDILVMAQEAGVRGFEEIPLNGQYVPRLYNRVAMNDLHALFGDDLYKVFESSLTSALQKVGREIDPTKTERVAKGMFKAIRKAHSGHWGRASGITLSDNSTVLREILEESNIGADSIDEILEMFDGLKNVEEVNVPARAKRRTFLDEEHPAVTLTDINGKEHEVHLQDLLVNDIEHLVNSYNRNISGHIGMARKGIKGKSEWNAIITQAKEEGATGKDIENMEFIYKSLTGSPIVKDPYSKTSQVFRTIRDLNFITRMNQVFWSMAAETGNLIAYGGLKNLMAHMPDFTKALSRAADGKLSHELAAQLEELIGTGTEWLAHRNTLRGDDEFEAFFGSTGKFFKNTDRVLEKGKIVTSWIGGLTPINIVTKRMAMLSSTQKLMNIALGKESFSAGRSALLGLSDEVQQSIFSNLKKYATLKKSAIVGEKVHKIDFERWAVEDPDSLNLFRTTLYRQVDNIIQESDIGDIHPLMRTELGLIATQFRGFTMTAWGRQTLSTINTKDFEGAMAFSISMLASALSYVGMVYTNHRNDRRLLRRLLKPENIAKNAFAKSTHASILPGLMDTALYHTGFDPQFSYARSTGLGHNIIQGNPTLQAIDAIPEATRMLRASFDPRQRVTQKQFRSARNLIMFQNALGVRQVLDEMQKGLPQRQYRWDR